MRNLTRSFGAKEDIRILLFAVISFGACLSWGATANRLCVSDFTPAEKCGACHAREYKEWQTSAHSRATTDPLFIKMLPQVVRDLGEDGPSLCLTCHAPVATATKAITLYAPVRFPLSLEPVAKEGVTCDFCHTISGDEYLGKDIGMGVYRYPRRAQTEIKYGLHGNASSHHGTGKSAKMKSGELCSICHKFGHLACGETWQDTYAEWKTGPYAKLGVRCQDCHMPKLNGEGTASASDAQTHAHVFVGTSPEMLNKVAEVRLTAQVRDKGDQKTAKIKAKVTNIGSGHFMPTGLPGMRQMWVQLVIRDTDGKEIFAKNAPIGMELLGADGKPTMPWKAVRLGKDTRIGPMKSRQTAWTFPFPPAATAPLEATVSVQYRAVSELAAQAAGIEASPPIQIASDQVRIYADGRVERVNGEKPAVHITLK